MTLAAHLLSWLLHRTGAVLMYLQKLLHMYCLQVARHACTLARLSIGASPAPVKLLHTLLQVTLLALSHACQLPCSR